MNRLDTRQSFLDCNLMDQFWTATSSAAETVLAGIDYVGLKLADFLGITQSKFQYYVDEAKLIEEEEQNSVNYDDLDSNRQVLTDIA
ncbi:hypothetical protein MP638_001688 [Amoeboaphelidium occidentale]|nr:hypothetical protein MP638_001688 [Amoeboaphelidium occidentale]